MKKIKVFFTGGTIAMRIDADGLLKPAVSGDELLAQIPQLQHAICVESSQFSNVASSQMSGALCMELRSQIIQTLARADIFGVVIVHGTDTMEESAFLLDAALTSAQLVGKTVVMTGAMHSAEHVNGDGLSNLADALAVASCDDAAGRGVLVAMAGQIHAARWVRKMDSVRVDTFASPNDAQTIQGTIARNHIKSAQRGSDGFKVTFTTVAARSMPAISLADSAVALDRVDIISMHSGADGALLNASIDLGAKAVVINAVGAGNVNEALFCAIQEVLSKQIPVMISTRCITGGSLPAYGYVGGGQQLQKIGACFAADLPAHKARLYAQLALAGGHTTPHDFVSLFEQLDSQ
jgi:L-asparaginase